MIVVVLVVIVEEVALMVVVMVLPYQDLVVFLRSKTAIYLSLSLLITLG